VTEAAIQDNIAYMDSRSPASGARLIARAWSDHGFRARLLSDGKAAAVELGIDAVASPDLVVVENTPEVHNLIVCTLCSCYPRAVLGRPPDWYKASSTDPAPPASPAPSCASSAPHHPRARPKARPGARPRARGSPSATEHRRRPLHGPSDAPAGDRVYGRGGALRPRHAGLPDRGKRPPNAAGRRSGVEEPPEKAVDTVEHGHEQDQRVDELGPGPVLLVAGAPVVQHQQPGQ